MGDVAGARRAAAIQVIGAQAATVHDDNVAEVVEMLLQVASGVWEAPLWSPLPELEALKAVASFGVQIPETAVDGILAAAGPALTAHTGASDTIANLLVQTYWAVETRRQDLADALARMLRLPRPPHSLWDLVPLAVRVPHCCGTIGTQESATVDLLLALLDADELVDVPPTELGPDKARPAGGILYSTWQLAEGEAGSGDGPGTGTAQDGDRQRLAAAPTPVVQDATSSIPDDAALTATGPPGDLAVAVAMHLTARTEDERDGGAFRAQAVSALHHLVNRLPPVVAGQLAQHLAAVHQAPRLSEADLWEISTDTPFSRARFNTGAGDLAELALATSAKAFAAAHTDAGVTDADRGFVDQAMASAARLLRDDSPKTRLRGALTVTAIATAASEFSGHATGLLFHGDEHVRCAWRRPRTRHPANVRNPCAGPGPEGACGGRRPGVGAAGGRASRPRQRPPSGRAPGHHERRVARRNGASPPGSCDSL